MCSFAVTVTGAAAGGADEDVGACVPVRNPLSPPDGVGARLGGTRMDFQVTVTTWTYWVISCYMVKTFCSRDFKRWLNSYLGGEDWSSSGPRDVTAAKILPGFKDKATEMNACRARALCRPRCWVTDQGTVYSDTLRTEPSP